jgi:hypothetical protein
MEFPGDLDFFDNEDFDSAVPRSTGEVVMELMAQIRPNGRVMDHFRIVVGGSSLLEVNKPLSSLIPAAALDRYKFKFQFLAHDVTIRRNMTTGKWLDVTSIIEANMATLTDLSGDEVAQDIVLEELESMEDGQIKDAAICYAVVIRPDQQMALEVQSLPASANILNRKPSFVG